MGRQAVPIADRFWEKADQSGGPESCWPWLAARSGVGYGRIQESRGGHNRLAHRVSYELVIGPIPEGMTIDHLCRHVWCVNPAHLEPVTMRVNQLRGDSVVARNARKTHCKRGHEFTPENTYAIPTKYGGMGRGCIECRRFKQSGIAERQIRFVHRRPRAQKACS